MTKPNIGSLTGQGLGGTIAVGSLWLMNEVPGVNPDLKFLGIAALGIMGLLVFLTRNMRKKDKEPVTAPPQDVAKGEN